MHTVAIDIGGILATGEVLSVHPLPAGRTQLQVRSAEVLPRGRTCVLEGPDGKRVECVVAAFTETGDVFIYEMRSVGDANFLRADAPGT
jgi:hypothetical protein